MHRHFPLNMVLRAENFGECVSTKDISKCGLCQQSRSSVSVRYVLDRHDRVKNVEINDCIHINSDTVLGENLE